MANPVIEKYRHRIVNAAIKRLTKKNGGNLLIIKHSGTSIETIEITENFMSQLMMRFEGLARGDYGTKDGDRFIKDTYQNAIEINSLTEYLTDSGKLIVDELLDEVIRYVKKRNKKGRKHGPDSNTNS